MIRIIIKRIILAIPVAFVSTILVFSIIQLAPGDPAQILAGPDATPEVIDAMRAQLGLDRPLIEQYVTWLVGIFRGDLGVSYSSGLPVAELLPPRMVATGTLILAGGIISVLLGIALGSLAGMRQGHPIDSAISALTGLMVGMPEFWFGVLMALVFAVQLGWLPPAGMVEFTDSPVDAIRSLILPALAVSLHPIAVIARTVRASIVDTLHEDYIRTARAKGVSGGRFYQTHVLKNAFVPILTIIGLTVTRLLGGSIVIETLFAWPGMGWQLITAITARDYQVVQANLLFFALAVIVVNLVVDIAYRLADPRIRTTEARVGV